MMFYSLNQWKSFICTHHIHAMDELRRIDLNLLLTLHALLTEKHVTRAAVRLHKSQPAVSHSLAQLRELFNDPLLVRKGGSMMLSARAQALIPPLGNALLGLNALLEAPEFDPARARGRFRIALSDYAAHIVLPKLMQRIRRDAPGLDVAISQASREAMLAQLTDGELDLALGIFPEASQEICLQGLFKERFICLADEAVLPADGKMDLHDWLARPHVMLALRPDATDEIERTLAASGLKRNIALALPHWSAAVSVISGTDLILTVASRAARGREQYTNLREFLPPLDLPEFSYQQAWHRRKDADPAHRWLREAIELATSD